MKPGRKTLTTREKRKRYVIYLSDEERAYIKYAKDNNLNSFSWWDPLETIKQAKEEWKKYPKQIKEKFRKFFEDNRYYMTFWNIVEILRTRWIDED